MTSYSPPTENLSEFNDSVFKPSNDLSATQLSQLNALYVQYPTAQGTLTANISGTASVATTIQTQNTSLNATHYLNFSDSSFTGYGVPQKNASLNVNPSTGTITATTFSGTASNVYCTEDDTATTAYIPFVQGTGSSSRALLVDTATTPLTYVPSTSTLTCTNFSATTGITTGSIRWTTNATTATFAGTTLTLAPDASSFRCLTYTFSGTTNSITALSLTAGNFRSSGVYYASIINGGSGTLTITGGSFGTGIVSNLPSGSISVLTTQSLFIQINYIGTSKWYVTFTLMA